MKPDEFIQKLKSLLHFEDTTEFLKEFFQNPTAVGALAPSSKNLAEEISRYVVRENKSKHYLEVGGGTGVLTHSIIAKLGTDDHLDIVEVNPLFCKKMEEKFGNSPNIHIHEISILDFKPDYQFDAIVSSLPFRAFDAEFVLKILCHYEQIIKPGGTVSFLEYIGIPELKKLFLNKKQLKEFELSLQVTEDFTDKFECRREKVMINFPPALVHHCQL